MVKYGVFIRFYEYDEKPNAYMNVSKKALNPLILQAITPCAKKRSGYARLGRIYLSSMVSEISGRHGRLKIVASSIIDCFIRISDLLIVVCSIVANPW